MMIRPRMIFIRVGTIATVMQLLKLPDKTVKVLVEGVSRARIKRFTDNPDFMQAEVEIIPSAQDDTPEAEALARSVSSLFDQYVKLGKKLPQDVLVSIEQIEGAARLADTIASHVAVKIPEKQELLEMNDTPARLEKLLGMMEGEISVLQVEKKIRGRVKRQMEKTQREFYLNEQMKAIQKELGEGENGKDEAGEIEARIKATKFSKEAREKAEGELKKLRNMSPMSAEATVVRNYLDWLLSIPWNKRKRVQH